MMGTSDSFTIYRQHGTEAVTLLQLLLNPLVLYQTIPYLPISSTLSLGATSKSFRELIHHTPGVFRYLNLNQVKLDQFAIAPIDQGGGIRRYALLDENGTKNDFYTDPQGGLFYALKQRHILRDVQTLILDGISVTSDLICKIILNESFRVRFLSIREVQNLNQRELMETLKHAVQHSGLKKLLTLEGIYIFGPKDRLVQLESERYCRNVCDPQLPVLSVNGVTSPYVAQTEALLRPRPLHDLRRPSSLDEDSWCYQYEETFSKLPIPGWEEILLFCSGIISFDAILCTGPRHRAPLSAKNSSTESMHWYSRPDAHLPAAIATIGLRGCSTCHSAPEGMFVFGITPPEALPLLAPPPLHSSTLKAATKPRTSGNCNKSYLLARCKGCLRGRYCESCLKWWCEDCFENSGHDQSPKYPEFVHSAFEIRPRDGVEANNLKPGSWRDCYECGFNCVECVVRTQYRCRNCRAGYCIIHNEGSTVINCDWCARSSWRTRDMY